MNLGTISKLLKILGCIYTFLLTNTGDRFEFIHRTITDEVIRFPIRTHSMLFLASHCNSWLSRPGSRWRWKSSANVRLWQKEAPGEVREPGKDYSTSRKNDFLHVFQYGFTSLENFP